jgi:D-3-phosphoglycerate dehydrogenase
MQLARTAAGGQAVSGLTVDAPVPAGVLVSVRTAISADLMQAIDIIQ